MSIIRYLSVSAQNSPARQIKEWRAISAHVRNWGIRPDYLDQIDAIKEREILEDFIQDHTDSHGRLTFDGVFANTDRQAYMVMKILKERGIRIPEDVQILGLTESGIRIDEGALFVSSMCQPVEALGRLCVETLLKKRQGIVVPTLSLLPVTYCYGGTTRREP